jgi:hypothetical protein
MSIEEKYQGVLSGMAILEHFAFPIIQEDLGEEKLQALKIEWQTHSKPIPEDATAEEKYEIAFENWIRNWQAAYNMIIAELGDKGKEKIIRFAANEWERKSAGAALNLYKFIRAIAPQTAFRTFGKQLGYTFQAMTPFQVTELTGSRMVIDVEKCKFLDFEGCDDPCLVGCMKVVPLWLQEQFKVAETINRKGKSCSLVLQPIK